MAHYDWDLIERVLHEVQNGAGHSFTPQPCAEQHAAGQQMLGETPPSVEHLAATVNDYENLLLARGFIAPRPRSEGGNGENFTLTLRGSSLLSLLDSSIPGNDHPRQVLDDPADALDPDTFDSLAAKAQIA
jgi:hypothetical protein